MLLLEDGSLYGCGDNSRDQLSPNAGCTHWKEWKSIQNDIFKDVACGWDFTAVINEDDEVLTRGSGLKGELGLGNEQRESKEWKRVMTVSNKSKIFATLHNCVVVQPYLSGSKVYGWGSNTKCQLFEPKCRIISRPELTYESEDVVIDYVAMGKDFLIYVDVRGRIVKATGCLPAAFKAEKWAPIENLLVRCMWTSVHILVTKNSTQDTPKGIYSFGNNSHGQLFDEKELELPLDIKAFTTGSEHGIIGYRTDNADRTVVACWGWGEHGNCGKFKNSDSSNSGTPLNEIFSWAKNVNAENIHLFGGCATTWIAQDE